MPARFLPPPTFQRLGKAARALAQAPVPDPVPEGWVSGFELEAMAAEALLGLLNLPLGADGDQRALLAVAEQITFRLEAGEDHGTKGSQGKGQQTFVVARNPFSGEAHAVSPVARALAEALIAEYAAAALPPADAEVVHGNYPGYCTIEVVW